jgi:hypothetical protein
MASLLERVRFLGGNGPQQEPSPIVPDDLGELLDPDPAPAAAVRDKPRNESKILGPKPATPRAPRNGGKFVSRAQVQTDLTNELDMWIKLMAATWSLSDEECAGALNATSRVIAEDLAKLGARSDWVMEKFTTTSLLGDIMKTAIHMKPFLTAVYRHHGPGATERRIEEQESSHYAVPVVDPNAYGPWRPPVG